jgi:hypothetical protein
VTTTRDLDGSEELDVASVRSASLRELVGSADGAGRYVRTVDVKTDD